MMAQGQLGSAAQ